MPPLPSRAMMRYRPASKRPGRKRPSLRYSGELEGRDEVAEVGRGGSGEVAVAKSRVARSSVLPAGAPQAGQYRPVVVTSVPQDEQAGMKFIGTVYRVQRRRVGWRRVTQFGPALRIGSCTRSLNAG